jgi:hypothetical protein
VPPTSVSTNLPKAAMPDQASPIREELLNQTSSLSEKFKKIDQVVKGGQINQLVEVLKDPRGLESAVVSDLARRVLKEKQDSVLGIVLGLINDCSLEPAIRDDLQSQLHLATFNGYLKPSAELREHYSKILYSPDHTDSNRRRALEFISNKVPEQAADAVFWCKEHAPEILCTASGVLASLAKSSDPRLQRFVAEAVRLGGMDEVSLRIRGLFDTACDDSAFLRATIKNWREAGIEPEYCSLLERSLKGKIEYPARYTEASLKRLLDVRENDSTIAAERDKPLVLFVMPKDGAKGTMAGASSAIEELQKKARVVVIESTGEKDLIAQTQMLIKREERKFSALLLNGHGDGANIALGTVDQLGLDSSKKDPSKTIDLTDEAVLKDSAFTSCFDRRVVVLLITCYGKRPPNDSHGESVFSMFKRVFPRGKIVGSDKSIEFKGFILNKDGVPQGYLAQ